MAVVDIQSATVVGDAVTIQGTVDGVAVQIQVWLSHLNTLANKAAKRTYVAQQLKAAAPAAPAAVDLSGTPLTV